MAVIILQHSDQIVTTLAKLPLSAFGSHHTKEVALVLARHMNKSHGWSASLYLRTIAKAAECTTRTVRNALRRLEALGFIVTTHRKHEHVSNWNLASVYRLGDKLRSLFKQSFRTPSKKVPAKVTPSLNKEKSNSKDPHLGSFVDKFKPKARKVYGLFDQERANRTHEEWAAYTKHTQEMARERNLANIARMKAMMGVA